MLDLLKIRDKCSKCEGNIVIIDIYCPHCGNNIPLPKNLDLISKKDDRDLKFVCHHASEKKLGAKFCPRCGDKL